MVASIMYYKEKGKGKGKQPTPTKYVYRGRKIRKWLKYFSKHRSLPTDRRGQHRSNASRIFDEGFQAKCRAVIADLPSEWSARDFRQNLLDKLHTDGTLPATHGISGETISFHLRFLGMELIKPAKGIYKDGESQPMSAAVTATTATAAWARGGAAQSLIGRSRRPAPIQATNART